MQNQPDPIDDQAKKEARAAQARLNGAKSHGPTSPEGKAISSKNALKHGFAAKFNILIEPDDSDAWDLHLAGHYDSYRPSNYAERQFVDELASISWRKARLVNIESALIDFQLAIQEEKVDQYFPLEAGNLRLHLALAWQALARTPLPRAVPADPNEPIDPTLPPDQLDVASIQLLHRYMTSLDRQFRNTLTNFRNYRKDFAPQAVAAPAAPAADAPQPVTAKPQPKPLASIEPQPQKSPAPNEPTNLVVMTPKPPAIDAPEEAA